MESLEFGGKFLGTKHSPGREAEGSGKLVVSCPRLQKGTFSKVVVARLTNDKAGNAVCWRGTDASKFQVQISSLFITPMGFIYRTESS